MQQVMVVHFQNQRDFTRVPVRAGFDESQRRGISIATRRQGQFKVIIGIVSRRVDRKAPGGTVLEALVHGQNYELAGSCQPAGIQYAREIRLSPWIVTFVPA